MHAAARDLWAIAKLHARVDQQRPARTTRDLPLAGLGWQECKKVKQEETADESESCQQGREENGSFASVLVKRPSRMQRVSHGWLAACLTSQQHAGVSQRRVCSQRVVRAATLRYDDDEEEEEEEEEEKEKKKKKKKMMMMNE